MKSTAELIILSESRLYAEGLWSMLDSRSGHLQGIKSLICDFDFYQRRGKNCRPQLLIAVLNNKKQAEITKAFLSHLPQSLTVAVKNVCLSQSVLITLEEWFDLVCSDQCLGESFVRKVDHLIESKMVNAHQTAKAKKKHILNEGYALTARERQVLYLISRSYSNKEIGETLYISDQTVSVHRRNLMKKLGAHNAAGLISKAFRERLIKL